MFGMAMMAVLMGVGFTSCSKDDNPNGSEKNLVKMVGSAGGTVGETWTFTYDDQGRVTSAILYSEFGLDAQFLWSDDAIVVSNDYSQPNTLSLNNGLVQSGSNGDTFTYNSSNRMTKWNHRTIMWDSDKVVSIGSDSFSYGTSCKKGYFPLIPYFIDDVDESMLLFTANPEIAGLETKQLPTAIYGMPTTYEFDKEGYISKISLNIADGVSLVYTLSWE